MVYNHITELIGNTPLLRIDPAVHGLRNVDVYAKLEYFNPFGSVKDRVAWGMIRDDLPSIQSQQQQILEMSSGNTAKALQILASVHGVTFKTITNRIKIPEQKAILTLLGAEVEELPGASDCHDPNDPNDPLVYIERERAQRGSEVYFTSQYNNPLNIAAHEATTGAEIVQDLPRVDYFFGGLGTTGSTRGSAQRMLVTNPQLKTVGIAATKQDYIPGIRNRDEIWEVGLFDPTFYDAIEYVTSQAAVDATLALVRRVGMVCGPTTGACYAGMLEYLKRIDTTLTERKTAVFIACDRLEWYTSYVKERRPDVFREAHRGLGIASLSEQEVFDVPSIEPANAITWIEDNAPIIVDTRGHQSFALMHIPGSINIPEATARVLVEQGDPFPKSRPLLFVCPRGEQSRVYAAWLTRRGYRAHNLSGGLLGWKDAQLRLDSHACCTP